MFNAALTSFSWMTPETAAIVAGAWVLLRLIPRVLALVELHMILRALPRTDRATAAITYLNRNPPSRRPPKP